MSVKVILGAMVVGSAVVIYLGMRSGAHDEPEPPPPAPAKPAEDPWLSPEASAQIVGEDQMPGLLFAGLTLGGPAPSAEARTRIAEFAKRNHVDLALDVVGDKLAAIRVDVTYGGCCGYEPADALGVRLRRPAIYNCLDCRPTEFQNDWTIYDAQRQMTASIRVNRVRIRWEPVISDAELYERAEALLGQDYEAAGKAAGSRWHELIFEHSYLLEVPYPLNPVTPDVKDVPVATQRDGGMLITVERRKIVEVAFFERSYDDNDEAVAKRWAAAVKRWGRPRVGEYEITWKKPDRVITGCCEGGIRNLTITRSP